MSDFSPSLQFRKRWIATPQAVKQAFFQEFDDIIAMLDSDKPVADFTFHHADFGADVSRLMSQNAQEPTPQTKLVPSLESVSLSLNDAADKPVITKDMQGIHADIVAKLSVQVDEFLTSLTDELKDELKVWLDNTVKNELANYQPRQDS